MIRNGDADDFLVPYSPQQETQQDHTQQTINDANAGPVGLRSITSQLRANSTAPSSVWDRAIFEQKQLMLSMHPSHFARRWQFLEQQKVLVYLETQRAKSLDREQAMNDLFTESQLEQLVDRIAEKFINRVADPIADRIVNKLSDKIAERVISQILTKNVNGAPGQK